MLGCRHLGGRGKKLLNLLNYEKNAEGFIVFLSAEREEQTLAKHKIVQVSAINIFRVLHNKFQSTLMGLLLCVTAHQSNFL